MRLYLVPPLVHPEVCTAVTVCLGAAGAGRAVQHWRTVPKSRHLTRVSGVAVDRSNPSAQTGARASRPPVPTGPFVKSRRAGRRGRSGP
jgi:hypothetical protein